MTATASLIYHSICICNITAINHHYSYQVMSIPPVSHPSIF